MRATHRKMDQPPKARPVRRQDTAMERRGAQVSSVRGHSAPQGAKSKGRLAALHPLGVFRGKEGEGRLPRAFENRGDDARHGFTLLPKGR